MSSDIAGIKVEMIIAELKWVIVMNVVIDGRRKGFWMQILDVAFANGSHPHFALHI